MTNTFNSHINFQSWKTLKTDGKKQMMVTCSMLKVEIRVTKSLLSALVLIVLVRTFLNYIGTSMFYLKLRTQIWKLI